MLPVLLHMVTVLRRRHRGAHTHVWRTVLQVALRQPRVNATFLSQLMRWRPPVHGGRRVVVQVHIHFVLNGPSRGCSPATNGPTTGNTVMATRPRGASLATLAAVGTHVAISHCVGACTAKG